MPDVLPNTTTTDRYQDTVMGGGSLFARGLIVIANNPVKLRVTTAPEWGSERVEEYPYVTPSAIPLVSGLIQTGPGGNNNTPERIVQVEVANAIAGQPAQVSGWLIEAGLAGPDLGTPFTSTVGSGGGITPGQASLQFQRNGALVSTQPILDFEDANLAIWSLVDDAANTRAKVQLILGGLGTLAFTDPAGTLLISNKLLAADTNYAFTLGGDGRMQWGPGGAAALDTALYRNGAGDLATDNLFRVKGASGYLYTPSVVGGRAFRSQLSTDAQPKFVIWDDGTHDWGPGGSTVTDTRVQRSAANTLQTSGSFNAVGGLVAGLGTSVQIGIGALGPSGQAGMYFGSAADTVLYRQSAGVLGVYSTTGSTFIDIRTDLSYLRFGSNADATLYREAAGVLHVTTHLVADQQVQSFRSAAQQVALTSVGGNAGIYFGNATDTNLYRSGAGTLRTDGTLNVGSVIIFGSVNTPGQNGIIGYASGDTQYRFIVSNTGQLIWGPGNAAQDTNLYRSAAGTLKTDGVFVGGNEVYATSNLVARTNAYVDFNNAGSKLYFGSAADTNLYRVQANVLRTDGTLLASLPNAQSSCAVDQALTTTDTDVNGTALAVTFAGTYTVTGVFDLECSVAGVGVLEGKCVANGVQQGSIATFTPATTGRASVTQEWIVSLAASQVVKLQASKTINAGTGTVHSGHTTMTIVRIGN